MKLIKKNLLVTAFMLCGCIVVLNAQSFIPDFLNEYSYIGEAYPSDEYLALYSIDNQFNYEETCYQLRSSGEHQIMGEDTPDPGTVPIDDVYCFWIAAAMLCCFRLLFRGKKKTLCLCAFMFFTFKSKRIVLFLSFLPLFSFSNSKYSFSLSVDPNVAYLYGDVAGVNQVSILFDDLKLKHIRYMLGGGIRQKINNRFSHKIGFAYGHFIAGERENTRLSYRGYAYNVRLCQLWWQPELTLLYLRNSGVYLFSGIGISHSSSKLTGSPIRLTDKFKGTETTALMPFGIGYETVLSKRWSLSTEVVCFYYFSDFIDGISTRFSSYNDIVGAVLFSVSYKISKDTGLYSKDRKTEKRYKCDW